MGEAKHTPTPWNTTEPLFAMNDGSVPIMAGEGKRVLLVDCQTKPERGEGWKTKCQERDANIALILRAVNTHEALVEKVAMAVTELEGATDALRDVSYGYHGYEPKEVTHEMDKIKAALASLRAFIDAALKS